MSRSVKHTSITGILGRNRSEKEDKRISNRMLRARARSAMARNIDPDALIVPVFAHEAWDVYSMTKDGKHYFDRRRSPKRMRK